VFVGGEAVHRLSENNLARWRGRHIGVVFQFFQLLPTLTTLENVMLPMDFCHLYHGAEREQRALSLLDQVGIAAQAHKLPAALSGGEQQRAAIARAIANDPPFIVADEPTGNLDTATAAQVFDLFESFVAQGRELIAAPLSPNFRSARAPPLEESTAAKSALVSRKTRASGIFCSHFAERLEHGRQRLAPPCQFIGDAIGERVHVRRLRAEHEHTVQVQQSQLLPWPDVVRLPQLLRQRHQPALGDVKGKRLHPYLLSDVLII